MFPHPHPSPATTVFVFGTAARAGEGGRWPGAVTYADEPRAASRANRQPTDPSPPRGGEVRRTWGVSLMVNARPPHPRVERAAGLQSLRSKIEEKRGKMRRSQVQCARHAFTSQLTLAVRRRNLGDGVSSVPDAGQAGSREGRETAGDGVDNPYRVEGRLGAEPQVAAASQRQPGARVDKPFRLGADGGRGVVGRARAGEGRWRCGTRLNRWKSKAMSDAFAAMGVEGDVGHVRSDEGRGRCRTRSHRWR